MRVDPEQCLEQKRQIANLTDGLTIEISVMLKFFRCLGCLLGLSAIATSQEKEIDLETALAQQDYGRAEILLEELVSDWKTLSESDPSQENAVQYGLTLQALGTIERQAGKQEEALGHLEKSCELLAEAAPIVRVDGLETFALALQDLGHLGESEERLREVLDLKRTANAEPSSISQSEEHLALNLLAQGNYPEAGELFQANLNASPAGQPAVRARRLGNFGKYLHTLGSYARAASIYESALELPFEDPELKLSLTSELALAELRLGKLERAREGLEKASEGARDLYQDSDRSFLASPYLINLGALDLSLGEPEQAVGSFSAALEILESSLSADHPALIVPLNDLGCAEQAIGDYENAGIHLRRAAKLQEKHLPRLHLRVAETARNLARNSLLSGSPDAVQEIDRSSEIGIELLDELIHHGTERERLNFLQRLDLVSLPCATGDPQRIAKVLIATKARLLDAMLAGGSAESSKPPTWQEIQATLPAGSAFIDACRYTTADDDSVIRYGAVLILPDGPPKWIPLGTDEDLQRWLSAFRNRLSWRAGQLSGDTSRPPTLKITTILQSLHRGFWGPIGQELPADTQDIAFSPDGALYFLPLAALLDADGQPLCTRHRQVTTVSSARDLTRPPAYTSLNSTPWAIFGVSDFPKSSADPEDDRLLNLLASLDSMPGTTAETNLVKLRAPDDSFIVRDEAATELALSRLKSPPGVLHLGCHAFFLPSDIAQGATVDFDENADLLRSGGLLLHRAGMLKAGSLPFSPTDDILFPSEVAKLPLKGTRLVTLSSCESGAGTAVSGEGLLGLRRGFALAGAREVLVALWPVSDFSTPEFMDRFYELATAGSRPAQALWQCQQEHFAKAESVDEFEIAVLRYGPFVLSQNTPLQASGGTIVPPNPDRFPWLKFLLIVPAFAFLLARVLPKAREKKE